MKNKIDTQIKNQETDRLLEEQYNAETKILEAALLRTAGKFSWEEFPEESEEEIQEGYDRLIAHLKEKGEYRETSCASSRGNNDNVKESRNRFDCEWNRTHRILKPVAAAVAAVMLTALIGMSITADFQLSDVSDQAYYTAVPEEK